MLPPAARMRRRADFTTTLRRGRAAARPTLVVHAVVPGRSAPEAAGTSPQVGFVVSRAVGGAVTRNLVTRRLRHLVRDRLDRLPAGSRLVVRATPTAAGRTAAQLGDDLDAALGRLLPQGG